MWIFHVNPQQSFVQQSCSLANISIRWPCHFASFKRAKQHGWTQSVMVKHHPLQEGLLVGEVLSEFQLQTSRSTTGHTRFARFEHPKLRTWTDLFLPQIVNPPGMFWKKCWQMLLELNGCDLDCWLQRNGYINQQSCKPHGLSPHQSVRLIIRKTMEQYGT